MNVDMDVDVDVDVGNMEKAKNCYSSQSSVNLSCFRARNEQANVCFGQQTSQGGGIHTRQDSSVHGGYCCFKDKARPFVSRHKERQIYGGTSSSQSTCTCTCTLTSKQPP